MLRETRCSFHPSVEGCPHAGRPDGRFGPVPTGLDVSRLSSPLDGEHWLGDRVRASVHHASTFLHPFARRALPHVDATMGALTPARVSMPEQVSLLHVCGLPDHSVSNHPVSRRRRFRTLPLSSTTLPPPQGRWVKASPGPSRLAGSTRPKRVRHPTDWSSTSCCSPPRLTATQLQSVTGWKAFGLKGTRTPRTTHACRRTRRDVSVPRQIAFDTRCSRDGDVPPTMT